MFRNWNAKGLVGLALAVVAFAYAVPAQQEVWTPNNESRAGIATAPAVARETFPTEFKLFNLNIDPLRNDLMSVTDHNAPGGKVVITIPNAKGGLEQFEVWETPNFDPELQARFPQIRAFTGQGITDPYATLKLSLSHEGVQGMVFRSPSTLLDLGMEVNEYLEPYSADRMTYAVFRRDRSRGESPWVCSTPDEKLMGDWNKQVEATSAPLSSDGNIRVLRLAQSCNGEYANYHGATTAGTPADEIEVLAAFNATLTRSNGVYEKDLGIHLNLIPQTTTIIFYNGATDPYTTLSSWNNQLRDVLIASPIGLNGYDIGHMFGASGGGGNAGCIGCVCSNDPGSAHMGHDKGRGITSPADSIPEGDNFDIDYVVHEVGHQIGANHTFSHAAEGTGVNKEVGSGITIMGYAGITGQDVAPHSIDVFHQASIAQIQFNMPTRPCPAGQVIPMTANGPPTVSAGPDYTIPISTPFALTATATDPQGDPITYNWEQNDNSTTTGAASVASPTKATGPNWLTFPSTSSPTRTFPRLSTIQAGLFVTPVLPGGDAIANIEALSSIGRTLNFRVTARDNRPYVVGSTVGQTQFDDMVVTVSAAAGPFKVTSPNTGISVAGGSAHTVTWDVASTTAAPVSTANVKISYSNDGGVTFPTVLAASTANDGSESVIIPVGLTSNARIKVEAVGNVFFDMSDANFSVVVPPRSRADFDGDSRTDLSVFRPSDGNWWLNRSTTGVIAMNWGLSTDVLTPGDYDGDAKTDLAVWRPSDGNFYVLNSSTSTFLGIHWGVTGDIPVVGDYEGDNRSDMAVYRQSEGSYYVLRSSGGVTATTFGPFGSVPVVGDFDGDAKADLTLFHAASATWRIRYSSGAPAPAPFVFGSPGDTPVTADYSGDNVDEFAVFRPTNGTWQIIDPVLGVRTFTFGQSGDVPVPGDYDGDGKDDVGIYRNGTWWIQRSTAGLVATAWGLATDKPIPKAYLP
jgi:hypothetical protein